MTATPTRPVHLLVVEDDEPIRRFLATTLAAEGHVVHEAADLRSAEALATARRIDLVLLDLGLPDGDGLTLIRRLRQWSQRPILVLSARSQEREKVQALDAGADDYLVKPVGVAELHARLRVALRHAAQTTLAGASTVQAGGLRIDLEGRTLHRDGELVRLTATEWRLLEALARRADRVVTSAQLLRDVWGPGSAEQGHYLRIYMRQLRQKLEDQPSRPVLLLTDPGIGYRLVTQPERPSGDPAAGAGEAAG
jgi:two-component system KDP operon response regulator KdpE